MLSRRTTLLALVSVIWSCAPVAAQPLGDVVLHAELREPRQGAGVSHAPAQQVGSDP